MNDTASTPSTAARARRMRKTNAQRCVQGDLGLESTLVADQGKKNRPTKPAEANGQRASGNTEAGEE